MSKTVDERVVSMQFDNKNFENNVQTSMSTLEKLKQSLNLSGAAKGLENVNSAASKVNMSGISNAVDNIKLKFSALQVMAVTALSNITNSAVNAGRRLVSAFTVDPIKAGFSEYETQINAVQTILANTQSKGTTLDQVNGALDELNSYADKTIYNFTEMTRNIGTFTAAGVDLDTSVSAIKGIANLAAVSGSNSQQASTAMYQLSQALASGTVKLMDWNSVVNAGMGGQVFQDALKETARVHGISIDEMIEKEGSFRETLSNGWLSSEILTETLSKFTGDLTEEQLKSMGYTNEQIAEIQKLGKTANDAATKVKTFTQLMDTLKEAAQSGWTQTWEILIGDFEEAKELWTSVSDVFSEVINSSAKARNDMLQGWADGGGRTMAIESIKNVFKALVSVIKPIKEAFREIFPRTTSAQLLKITENIRDFTKKLILSEKAQAKLKSTFKGLFAVIDIGVTIVKAIVGGIVKLIGSVASLGGGFIDTTASIGDWLSGLRDSIKKSNIFARAINKIVEVLQKAIEKIKEFAGFIKAKVVAPGFETFLNILRKIWDITKILGKKVVEVIGKIGKSLAGAFRNGDMKSAMDLINGGIISAILLNIKKFTSGFGSSLEKITSISKNISEILDSVRGCFEAYQKNLKANALLKIAGAIGILAVSILLIASIDPNRLNASLGAIAALFAELIASMALFNKIGTFQKGLMKATAAMIGVSVAVLILASALKVVSSINPENMLSGIFGIAALSAIIVVVAKSLSKNTETIIKGATSLIAFALAIKILASACKDISNLSWEEMKKGLVGVAALMAAVLVFMNNVKFGNKAMSNAIGIVILASSLKILASACSDFSKMSWSEMIKGLAGVAWALIAIMAAVNLAPKNMMSIGLGLLAVSAGISIIAKSLTSLGGMTWEGIAKGLIALSGSLLILAGALYLMQGTLLGSAALIIASVAILMLVPSLMLLGKLSWESIGKGLVALAGSLLILAVGLTAMIGSIPGAAALIIASGAILVLAGALLILGAMSWEGILKSLIALAGAFTILGLAGLVLGPIVPIILALAGALLLTGAGMLAFGAGVLAFSIGLTTLAAALSTSGTIIVAGITAILEGIIGLIPSLIAAIGQGIILICDTIAKSAGSICSALTVVITSLMKALKASIPTIVETIFVLLDAVLTKLVEYTPKIVKAVFNILIACLDGIAEGLPLVVKSAVDIVVNFLNGIGEQLPRIVQAGFDMVIKFIDGLTEAIDKNTPILIEKVKGLFKAILRAAILILTGGVVDIKKVGSKIMNSGLVQGIKSGVGNVKESVSKAIKSAKDAVSNKISEWNQAGKDLINGLIEGVKSKFTAIKDAAVNGVKGAVKKVKDFLGINSPSKLFIGFGKYMDEGLIVGLKSYANDVSKSALGVGESAASSMSGVISNVSDMIDSGIDAQPTIRPVLDLSEVQSGAKSINGMFGMKPSVGVMSNIGQISSMMNNNQNGSNDDVVSAIKELGGKLDSSSGGVYNINGVTYDDGSNIYEAVKSIVRAARVERRI